MLRRILEQSKEPAFADDILVFWLNRLVEQHAWGGVLFDDP